MKIAIIGIGGLGSAIARGLVAAKASARGGPAITGVAIHDRNIDKVAPFANDATIASSPVEAVRGAEVVLLAVKPKATPALATSVEGALGPETLLVSCAAGVPLSALPAGRPTARAMPSIGAACAASTTAILLGERCVRPRDAERLRAIFSVVGEVREVPDESWMPICAAVAASGPAFLLVAVEALVDAGVEAGLPRKESLAYAAGALRAAAGRLEAGIEPQALRALITSPGGMTAAGLAALESAAVRGAFLDAVRAGVARSKSLGEPVGAKTADRAV